MYYLNNCRNRKHQTLFGNDAFFDFDEHGIQEKLAGDIRPGDICIVASYDGKNSKIIKLLWFTYSRQDIAIDDRQVSCRVFRGHQCKVDLMLKTEAYMHPEYSCFFDKLGRFKQVSMVKPKNLLIDTRLK